MAIFCGVSLHTQEDPINSVLEAGPGEAFCSPDYVAASIKGPELASSSPLQSWKPTQAARSSLSSISSCFLVLFYGQQDPSCPISQQKGRSGYLGLCPVTLTPMET